MQREREKSRLLCQWEGGTEREGEGEDCAASAAARWPFVRVVAGLRLRRRCRRCSGSAATISSLGRIPQHNVSLICWILFALPPPSSLSLCCCCATNPPSCLSRTHAHSKLFCCRFFSLLLPIFCKFSQICGTHTHTYIHTHAWRQSTGTQTRRVLDGSGVVMTITC